MTFENVVRFSCKWLVACLVLVATCLLRVRPRLCYCLACKQQYELPLAALDYLMFVQGIAQSTICAWVRHRGRLYILWGYCSHHGNYFRRCSSTISRDCSVSSLKVFAIKINPDFLRIVQCEALPGVLQLPQHFPLKPRRLGEPNVLTAKG